MPLSRSATDRLFAGTAGFAHRGLHGPGIPENSMEAFRAAIASGSGIECDLRLSRDGLAVVFHDSSLQRLCGLAAETESIDSADLLTLTLAGSQQRIPRLDQLLHLAGQTPLLLELKVQAGNPPPPVERLCRTVAESLVHHRGPVGVMSFDPRVPAWLARHVPHLPRGLVIADRLSAWRRFVALRTARADFLAVETGAATRPWVAAQRRRRRIASWTVRTSAERMTLSDCVDALIWEGDGRP